MNENFRKILVNADKTNSRLKTILYNAVTLLVDETIEQYDDIDEWKKMMERELGCTINELKQYGINLTF